MVKINALSAIKIPVLVISLAAGLTASLGAQEPAEASIAPGPFGEKSQLLAPPQALPSGGPSGAQSGRPLNERSKELSGSVGRTPAASPTVELGCADLRRNALRMSVHASNLANRETTRTPDGTAYKRLEVICKAAGGAFCNVESIDDTKLQHSPGHPDADASGFVKMPIINAGAESAGLNTAAGELKMLATRGICGARGIQDGLMTVVKYEPGFEVMMDTMTFTADGRVARWSRTTRDGKTQNLSFKDDGTPVGL